MGIGSILAKSPFVKKVLGKVVRKGLSTAPKKNVGIFEPTYTKTIKPNELEKSQKIGEQITAQEKLYHDNRQAYYSSIWRGYPTKQFYRVVGQNELNKLLRRETIVSENSVARYNRKCVDITSNPNYHEIFYGEEKFRIPFLRKTDNGDWNTKFTSKIYEFNPEKGHYQIPSYNLNDVDITDIQRWNGEGWEPFDLLNYINNVF